MELKRFDFDRMGDCMTEEERGEYVRFADVEPLLAHMDEQVRTLAAQNAAMRAGASAQCEHLFAHHLTDESGAASGKCVRCGAVPSANAGCPAHQHG